MNERMIAHELLRIAKALTAYTEDDKAKVTKLAKQVKAAKTSFESANMALIEEINGMRAARDKMDEIIKVKETELGASFKAFDKSTGLTKTSKDIAATVAAAMSCKDDIGRLLDNLADDEKALIAYGESSQLSYKSAFEMLATLLNGTEYEKYVKLILDGARKNIVTVERAVGQTVTTAKSFSEEYVRTYDERAAELAKRDPSKRLPPLKAGVSGVRTAGVADLFAVIGDWITRKFEAVGKLLSDLWGKLAQREGDLQKAQGYVMKLNDAAKKASK